MALSESLRNHYEYGMEKLESHLENGDYDGAIRFLQIYCSGESRDFYFQLLLADLLFEHGDGTDATHREVVRHYKSYLHIAAHGWDAPPNRFDPVGFKRTFDESYARQMRQMYGGTAGPIHASDIERAKGRVAEIEHRIGPVSTQASCLPAVLVVLLLLLGGMLITGLQQQRNTQPAGGGPQGSQPAKSISTSTQDVGEVTGERPGKSVPISARGQLIIQPGLAVTYACRDEESQHPNYDCWLRILAHDNSSIHYEWQTRRDGQTRDHGDRWTTALDSSRDFNFFWDGRERGWRTTDTAPWVSHDVLADLEAGKSTVLNIEKHSRTDRGVKVRVTGRGTRTIGSHAVPVLELVSTAGDGIVVVDDPGCPLILEINVPNVYSLQLKDLGVEADVADEPDPAPPAAPAPPQSVRHSNSPVTTPSTSPQDEIRAYFKLINDKALESAYSRRSQRFRSKMSLRVFRDIWSNNNWLSIDAMAVESRSSTEVNLRISVRSNDRDRKTGMAATVKYAGPVRLVLEGGRWRYDDASLKPVDPPPVAAPKPAVRVASQPPPSLPRTYEPPAAQTVSEEDAYVAPPHAPPGIAYVDFTTLSNHQIEGGDYREDWEERIASEVSAALDNRVIVDDNVRQRARATTNERKQPRETDDGLRMVFLLDSVSTLEMFMDSLPERVLPYVQEHAQGMRTLGVGVKKDLAFKTHVVILFER